MIYSIDSKSARRTLAFNVRSVLATAIALAALTGCGGGGGSFEPASSSGSSGSSGSGTGGNGGSGGSSGSGGSGGSSGGGSGGSGDSGGGGSTSGAEFVYLAGQGDPTVSELYMKTATGSVKLNGPLVSGGWVYDFAVSPNGEFVVYTADEDVENQFELYVVQLANPGSSTKLNTPFSGNQDIEEFEISPNSDFVVYTADQDIGNRDELYVVSLANPGASTKLNAPMIANSDVTNFRINPDGSKVAYRADAHTLESYELFIVDVANPGSVANVNSPLVAGGSVFSGFSFSPDGTHVGYIADQEVDERLELFAVPVATPGLSARLNGPMTAEGDLCRFEFSHDSTRVAYCGDQETDGVEELFLVSLASPGVSQKLNPTLVSGGNVGASYDFSPDDSFIVYEAEQDVADRNELYRVDLATPGVATKLNAPIVAAGIFYGEGEDAVWYHGVDMFHIRPDGQHVAYTANQDSSNVWELYDVDLASPGTATKLNPAMAGEGMWDFRYAADGGRIVYRAAQDSAFLDLFGLEPATPGVSSKLNGTLPTGWDVWDFAIVP